MAQRPSSSRPGIPSISKTRADRVGVAARNYIYAALDLEAEQLIEVARGVSQWRQTHAYPLALVTPGVRNWVTQETAGPVIVGQRLKRFDRILSKLNRFPTMRLSQMEDIAGCRTVLLSPTEVEAVARRIRRKWDVRDVNDYREQGKPGTGYRGLHLIVLRRERLVEIQLRTTGQHYWAEMVERTSSRTGQNLKDGQGAAELLEYFSLAAELTWQREEGRDLDAGARRRLEKLRPAVRQYFQQPPTGR